MVKTYLFFVMLLPTCCAFVQAGCRAKSFPHAREPEGAEPVRWEYVEANDITEVTLASEKKLFLHGRFDIRSTLWGEYSLVYLSLPHWKVLDVGDKHGWWLFAHHLRAWSRKSGPTLSVDGKICFLWLDIEKQLTAIDISSGKMRTLTHLPTRIMNYKGDRRFDPAPVWRDRGVVHDAERNRVLFLIQEETNEEVAFWQRRPGHGGYQIIAVDLDEGRMTALSGSRKLKGKVYSWDLSLKRWEVYVYTQKGELQVRTLDGQLLRKLPIPKRAVLSMWLSPDEERLLVQNIGGGFALIDLETSQIRDGPSHGHSAAWSPDGRSIAYLDAWQLWLYDVATRTSSLLASREPTHLERGPGYRERPAWSPDGNMLAANVGGDYPTDSKELDAPTLIIDLKDHTAMVFPDYIENILWVAHPRPFRGE